MNIFKQNFNNSNNKYVNVNFSFKPYSLEQIISDLRINKVITNQNTIRNIASTVQTIYFYKDLISNNRNNLPIGIIQNLLKELIIQSFSILECIEIELGAKLLNINRNTGNQRKSEDLECLKAVSNTLRFPSNSIELELYKYFKNCRHNVHLSKSQNIFDTNSLNERNVTTLMSFLTQYIEYIVNWYDMYLNTKNKFKFKRNF